MSDSTGNGSGATSTPTLTKKDFQSDQEVRWCPGCGDYAILNAVQTVFPSLGIPRERFVVVSGIGCSSRFPYYMNTYGFHTIHGRAPSVATGLKLANPDLQVWVVTGDGDALSIGGNHFMHALRRNVDIKILLFNNRIYGLTKGQYSPTSEVGKNTKSTPHGSIDRPINPLTLAIGAEATFVASAVDVYKDELQAVLKAAAEHRGTAFVHIYQNCNIFNDGAFDHFTDRGQRDETNLFLEPGKPMIFGKNKDRGLMWQGRDLKVVQLGDGISESDLAVHDPSQPSAIEAFALSRLEPPYAPVPIGILRQVHTSTYDQMALNQVSAAIAKRGMGDIQTMLDAGDTWEVT